MKVINSTGYQIFETNIVKAKGMKLYNDKGKAFLDFESGVWALPLGHNPKSLNKVFAEQTKELTHIGYLYASKIVEDTAERLLDICGIEDGKCVFLSSGSEAVEYAMQVAKKLKPDKKGLRFNRYYLSAYGNGSIKNPDWIEIFDSIEEIDFTEIGYFFFEPGNFSGMVKLPEKQLILNIIEKVRENDGLILVDEVTTGFGRTGEWFGFMHYDFQPDIIAMGKGMGNGYPVSAVVFRTAVIETALQLGFGYAQSHQNDPLGAKIVLTVIEELEKCNLLDHTKEIGNYFRTQLGILSEKHPFINHIRGVGLMNAMNFNETLDSEKIKRIQTKMFDRGFFIQVIPSLKIMRFYPPLIITEKEIDQLIRNLDEILNELQ